MKEEKDGFGGDYREKNIQKGLGMIRCQKLEKKSQS